MSDRVAALPPDDEDLAVDAYLKPRESRELPPAGLAILRELFLVRHAMARGLDRPPFKVVRDEVLHAGGHPTALEALDVGGAEPRGQEGVLGEALEVAAAERGALQVDGRSQQDLGPLGAGLLGQCRADAPDPTVTDAPIRAL